ncbi:Ribonuclease H [Amphibalanus amphitrite]|uniref:ribonuclease H n=1 Tax=Amphibalanus amphitrite TaxID=1232801 RepID=A0A6A4W1Q4_AMPAM|nr:Ribonuclease H [Amphibalanus amphitrite]
MQLKREGKVNTVFTRDGVVHVVIGERDRPRPVRCDAALERISREVAELAERMEVAGPPDAGISAPIEPILPRRVPPWEQQGARISFTLDVGPLRTGATAEEKERTAAQHLASLPQCAVWMWSDGSAEGGTRNGGTGAVIMWPDEEVLELRAPAGDFCSSYRAEMLALVTGLETLTSRTKDSDLPLIICSDSMSALATLRNGPAAQTSPLGTAAWRALLQLAKDGREIRAQWVPSHCGIHGNEEADRVAREAAQLPQERTPIDTRTITSTVARMARDKTIQSWPPGWFKSLMGDRRPPSTAGLERESAVEVHQIRAGHWAGSRAYLHRIGRSPTRDCEGCNDDRCDGARCPICGEEADRPAHILLRCPALMRTRLQLTGSIHPDLEEVQETRVVAALAAASRNFQSRLATPR